MKLSFLNRDREIQRIQRSIHSTQESHLLVIYGRRRLGKSTLLQHILREHDIYYLAPQSDKILQIQTLAAEIARTLPGFDEVEYSTWEALFKHIAFRCEPGTVVVLDEFPYLVAESPELPSILQHLLDTHALNYHLILCGSSQRMMHGIVLDQTAPLYGRAKEILKIEPLPLGWLQNALYPDAVQCIEGYSIWGGVPRYWELAADFPNLEEAVKDLILDRYGVLHQEPQRILLDDMNSTTQTNSIIAVIAHGAHRLTEICARLQKPATNLSRPLANLRDLGYITRELPFGESEKSTKKTLYKIADPYLQFWYRFVFPQLSLLEVDRINLVYQMIQAHFASHAAGVWEDLARTSCAWGDIAGIAWKPGQRWWGNGKDGKVMEIDVIAESADKTCLLLGEVKWSDAVNIEETLAQLRQKSENLPCRKPAQNILFALWTKHPAQARDCHIITPDMLCALLQ